MTSSPVRHVLIVVESLPVPLDRRVWQEATPLVEAGYLVSVICPAMRGWTTPFEGIDGVHLWRHLAPLEAHAGAVAYARGYGDAQRHWFRLARKLRSRRGPLQVIHGCNPPDLVFVLAWRRGLAGVPGGQADPAPHMALRRAPRLGRGLLRRTAPRGARLPAGGPRARRPDRLDPHHATSETLHRLQRHEDG